LSKDDRKSTVFSSRRNVVSDGALLTDDGRLFHTRAEATGKVRSPSVERLVTVPPAWLCQQNADDVECRRRRRVSTSDVLRRLPARYVVQGADNFRFIAGEFRALGKAGLSQVAITERTKPCKKLVCDDKQRWADEQVFVAEAALATEDAFSRVQFRGRSKPFLSASAIVETRP